jgi:hypothetical protein
MTIEETRVIKINKTPEEVREIFEKAIRKENERVVFPGERMKIKKNFRLLWGRLRNRHEQIDDNGNYTITRPYTCPICGRKESYEDEDLKPGDNNE